MKLGDIADEVTVGHVGSMVHEYRSEGIPLLRSQNVLPHDFDLKDVKYIDRDFHARLKKSALRPGDVVTVRTGKPGATAVVPMHWAEANCSDLIITRPGSEINAYWLSYYINSVAAGYINSQLVGAVQQHFNVGAAKNIMLNLPPLHEQQAIAEALGALDDKIAANTKLVSLVDDHMGLEYSAAVLGSASASHLNEVAEFHNRKRVPLSSREREQRPGDVPYYGASGVFGTVDTAIFDEPLVLVGEDGTVINGDGTPVCQYIWGPAWVNNHAHVLTGKGISTELLFLAIKRTQVITLVTGAVQPKINMGNLKRLTLETPSVDRLGRLEQIVKTETAVKRAAIEESRTLAATRDVLLPQLMSGKLRVKEAQKVLEDVRV
ncbi:restriction endonuclease subunit S [[Arthrobacter] sp. ATCC 21022]|uniref:restriction endonuclease subunit S n=1 Tax=[Arthrobacter] sp. ATCC 21022 TaxID=1771959 RepID=UPI002AA55297